AEVQAELEPVVPLHGDRHFPAFALAVLPHLPPLPDSGADIPLLGNSESPAGVISQGAGRVQRRRQPPQPCLPQTLRDVGQESPPLPAALTRHVGRDLAEGQVLFLPMTLADGTD